MKCENSRRRHLENKHTSKLSTLVLIKCKYRLDYRLDDRGDGVRFPAGEILLISLVSITSRPALGPTQLSIQWVPRAVSLGQSGRGVKLITHLYLVLRLRMVALHVYIDSPMRLHGAQLNLLSSGITLLLQDVCWLCNSELAFIEYGVGLSAFCRNLQD
jgi:hypothetical protein